MVMVDGTVCHTLSDLILLRQLQHSAHREHPSRNFCRGVGFFKEELAAGHDQDPVLRDLPCRHPFLLVTAEGNVLRVHPAA